MSVLDSGYLTEHDLRELGFARVGTNVRVARNCTILEPANIEFGDHVRIDGYTMVVATGSGRVKFGSHIHIAAYVLLSGSSGITLDDFAGVASGTRVFSRTDDYSGAYLTGPTVPSEYTNVTRGAVRIGRHVVIGAGSVVLPGCELKDGVAVGAQSLVNRTLDEWGIYVGAPARRIKDRSKRLLELEAQLLGGRNA
jgi:galactoside O-acetyltransferase